MPWSTMLIRSAVVNVMVVTGDGGVVVYWIAAGFLLVNYLWPLWDNKNQALHDKAARTNVVVVRRRLKVWVGQGGFLYFWLRGAHA